MELLSDALARIQNGIMAKKAEVELVNTKAIKSMIAVLKREKMIDGIEEREGKLFVTLAYRDGEAVISHLEKVSKPGQRIYIKAYDIKPIMNGRGVSIISTSKGIMCGAVAKSKGLGGEFICKVW